MKILHGTWIPEPSEAFIQTGEFYLWVETDTPSSIPKKKSFAPPIPHHLQESDLADFLRQELGLIPSGGRILPAIAVQYFCLPSTEDAPLPSWELSRYLEQEPPTATTWKSWAITCYPLNAVVKTLADLHFLCSYYNTEIQLGSDLLFWYHYTQAFKQIIHKDLYIPALTYREVTTKPARGKAKTMVEIYPSWEILSDRYEAALQTYSESMPLVCAAGHADGDRRSGFYDKLALLKHFSACLLQKLIDAVPIPAVLVKKYQSCPLLEKCLSSSPRPWTGELALDTYQKWLLWRQKLVSIQGNAAFHLALQLEEASEKSPNHWSVKFFVSSKADPSLKLELTDYWSLGARKKGEIKDYFGKDFEKDLLLSLGYAASIYPKIWQGLETDEPVGFTLTLQEAFEFLKESAWILEDAGYKVIVPAWWTPEGRQRAKIRIKGSPKKSAPSSVGKGHFQLSQIIQYHYELAIGDQPVTEAEWQQLVEAKSPLVKFRGQWMELDPSNMEQMLNFWQTHQQGSAELTLLEWMQKSADAKDGFEVESDQSLESMMTKLFDASRLEPIDDPHHLQGNLRDYQKRGVAWISYLEKLGLNGCLADDMGLGKTIQVIAALLRERESNEPVLPTLLIAPTSVVGNWFKEIAKFAPNLRVLIHHGGDRLHDEQEFKAASLNHDVVITSYTLARKDAALFALGNWRRVVLDEAQNIKNPKAAQTKAILKLESQHRLALTGTPIENRLLDLWSIFNFLNPGYLGKEAQFRKTFELPIQKENNLNQSRVLKKLVEPFILRRVKTDKEIIKDLPDKIEHKQYCNLTKEQASLYEAVVKDVMEQLEDSEGMQRKGLILSTLMKLKQICNHPRQFLQDNSDFTPERSHKLTRLGEMLEEIIAEGESLLIFTQFTEIGEAIQKYLKLSLHYPTYYLHGGTSRPKREQMISEFQDPDSDPSAFVLSLKAGGVGITLTKANHVFHFDRWWNPAVEDQATDRAFRIGQKKNVFVHKFVTLGTLEERIDQMIEDKKSVANLVVGSDESWLTELDNNSFKALIALNRQTVI